MNDEPRYEIKNTGFGPNFYDAGNDRDLTLADVLALLNGAEAQLVILDRVCQKASQERGEYERECVTLKNQLEQMTAEHNALAAEIEAERDGNLALRRRHGARDDETMFAFIDRLAAEKVDLEAANNALRSDLEELDERLGREHDEAKLALDEICELVGEGGDNTPFGRVESLLGSMADEKRHRVYYQGVVYDVCAILDKVLGQKTVCGTADEPNREAQRGVEKLVTDLETLRGQHLRLSRDYARHLADIKGVWTPRERQWVEWAEKVAGLVGANVADTALQQSIEDLVGPGPHHAPEDHNRRPGPFVSRKYHHDVVDNQRKTIDALRAELDQIAGLLLGNDVPLVEDDKNLTLFNRVAWLVNQRGCARQAADALDRKMTEARNALTAAGVEDWEPYPETEVDEHEASLRTGGRQRSVAERIAILARRSTPHEDPRRTAHVAGLERAAQSVLSTINDGLKRVASTEFALALEQLRQATRDQAKPTGLVTKDHHDGAMATLVADHEKHLIEIGEEHAAIGVHATDPLDGAKRVRAMVDALHADHQGEVQRLTEHNEMLKTANLHMADKLARIAELPAHNPAVVLDNIKDIILEQLSPHDPAMVELERANMLAEIDDVLQRAGCWRGGRLDSIKQLIEDKKSMLSDMLNVVNRYRYRVTKDDGHES